MNVAVGAFSALCVAAVAAVLVWRSGRGRILGLTILCTPLAVKALADYQRPDQVALVVIIPLVAFASTRSRAWMSLVLLAVSGTLLSASMLVHDGIVTLVLPWSLVVVAFYSSGIRDAIVRGVALGLSPLATAVLVIRFGAVSAFTAAQMKAAANPHLPSGRTAFYYLDDTLADSVAGVVKRGWPNLAAMAFMGTLLALLTVVPLVVGRATPRLLLPARGRGPKLAVQLGLVLCALGLAFNLVTAFDWTRWFALWVTAAGSLSQTASGSWSSTVRSSPLRSLPASARPR